MREKLLYVIKKNDHVADKLKKILNTHGEIKFVSLAGVDLIGHETEEKIPIQLFIDNIDTFLNGIAIQTDGSSVYLPNIATLDNAKIDMKADLDRNWFVDYNEENIDKDSGLPIGTLKIPCFLFHEGLAVGSRHILLHAMNYFEKKTYELTTKSKSFKASVNFDANTLEEINITAATELEFWAMTPNDERGRLELSTSQELHEQYWSSTRGSVRTALEETLLSMEKYGLEPEMGHKEVGGVRAKLNDDGSLSGIMEQLEIDWKYSDALQAADNELFVKKIIKEVFRKYGMNVTFLAKPIQGVAGSGEHTHIGVSARLSSGKVINLFNSNNETFLSIYGYGALMGLLKNYEIINPFVTSSNEAFKRLKKGFEAPICTVTSLGKSVQQPSRNRSVLIGLVRDQVNPMATRFELRSPNPHTNTFLCLTAMLLAMLDGVEYSLKKEKNEEQLLAELSKNEMEHTDYLEDSRVYRSEKDVFDDFTDEEREQYFGQTPTTVYENIQAFERYPAKLKVLQKGHVFTNSILSSFKTASINKWVTEIEYRILPVWRAEIIQTKKLHDSTNETALDQMHWKKVNNLRKDLAKDTQENQSLLTTMKEMIHLKEYLKVSELQKQIDLKMNELQKHYDVYKNNIIE